MQEALSNQFSIPTSKEYICKKCDKHLLVENMPTNSAPSCDKGLKETSNENSVLSYYGKYPNAVAGANFLKALNQRPEYVWTC